MRKTLFKIILLLSALVAIAVGVSLLFPNKPLQAAKSFPSPNGYDALISAGAILTTPDFKSLNPEELRVVVEANSNALQTVRAAFSNEWQVPLFIDDKTFSNHMAVLPELKRTAQAFAAEGRLAENKNRADDAARAYLDSIELGIRSARGGVLIDGLVSMAAEAIGTRDLQTLVPRLGATTCKESARILQELDAHRESGSSILANERVWSRLRSASIRDRFAAFMQRKTLNASFKKFQAKFDHQQTELRHLMVQLAARAYQLDNGAPPKTIADLVPHYLKTIPTDPITGTNLTYLP